MTTKCNFIVRTFLPRIVVFTRLSTPPPSPQPIPIPILEAESRLKAVCTDSVRDSQTILQSCNVQSIKRIVDTAQNICNKKAEYNLQLDCNVK